MSMPPHYDRLLCYLWQKKKKLGNSNCSKLLNMPWNFRKNFLCCLVAWEDHRSHLLLARCMSPAREYGSLGIRREEWFDERPKENARHTYKDTRENPGIRQQVFFVIPRMCVTLPEENLSTLTDSFSIFILSWKTKQGALKICSPTVELVNAGPKGALTEDLSTKVSSHSCSNKQGDTQIQ